MTEQFNALAKHFLETGTSGSMAEWIYYCRERNLFHLGISIGEQYLDIFAHNFRFLTELSICYYHARQYKKAFACSTRLMKLPMTEDQSKAVFFNMHFCIDHIFRMYENYPKEIVETCTQNVAETPSTLKLVTFTITTCKRLDLFCRTINSFLQCCTDTHRIDRWICVDDNSSKEDRATMKELYPFFEFVWKSPEQKGHAQSMNILRSMVKTPFFFHMEDDWQFFIKRPYILDCLRVLEQGERYGQCLVNKNYAEVAKHIDILGGEFKQVEGMRYYVHSFYPNIDEFHQKYGYGPQCAYWPHYSLRPGLCKTKIYKELGEFNPSASHFEMEYATRYVNHGYQTTFLEYIHAIHIGRLTSERFNTDKENAYTLNDEKQFIPKDFFPEEEHKEFKSVVVNLERRPDRLDKFRSNAPFVFEPYKAIDGQNLHPTIQLCQLFNFNDYNYRRGMIGCALSHIDLWINLLNSKDDDIYLIVEDDVEFADDFSDKCQSLIQGDDWDIIFLGHHLYSKFQTPETYNRTESPTKDRWNTIQSFSKSMGGTGGYMINKHGALKMLNFIQTNGMTNGIDTMMQHACDTLMVYYCFPHLIYSECATRENIETVDTDIQRDYSSLRMDVNERLQKEKEWFMTKDIRTEEIHVTDTLMDTFLEETQHGEDDIIYILTHLPNDFNPQTKITLDAFYYFIDDKYMVFIPPPVMNAHPTLMDTFKLLKDGEFSLSYLLE